MFHKVQQYFTSVKWFGGTSDLAPPSSPCLFLIMAIILFTMGNIRAWYGWEKPKSTKLFQCQKLK